MDVLETLSVALGLATLAGINLYLTVFVTGMAVHFGWVVLPSNLQDLLVLGDPWVIAIAGALYFMEFFADKIPWVDSANDALHTFVRPLGGALLAVLALGQADPSIKVIAALLAGGAALTAHAAKAGTRLVANFSPEPISNIGLSLGGDALVLGGLGLLLWHPLVALVVAIVALGLTWTFLPGLLRGVRATLWLAWRKLVAATGGSTGIAQRIAGRISRRLAPSRRTGRDWRTLHHRRRTSEAQRGSWMVGTAQRRQVIFRELSPRQSARARGAACRVID